MRKILVSLSILSITALGCAGNYSSSHDNGFVTLDFTTTYTLDTNKDFNIAGIGSITGAASNAVYYEGTYSNTSVIGFAVQNGYEKLVMYSTDGGTNFTIIRTTQTATETVTTSSVSAITDVGTAKRIEFTAGVAFPVSGITSIATSNYIVGAVY